MNTLVSLQDATIKPEAPIASETPTPELEATTRLDRPPEPDSKRPAPQKRRTGATAAAAMIMVVLAYWQRNQIPIWFSQLLPYSPAIAFVVLGLIGLFYKDKDKYAHPAVVWIVACFMVTFGFLMGLNTYRERADAAVQKKENAKKLEKLSTDLAQARKDNADDGKTKAKALDKIAEDLKDFKNKVRVDELHADMSGLSATMQKVLHPPKAAIQFSFGGFKNPKASEPFVPLREITVTANAEGVVKIPLALVNYTETEARQGHVNFHICGECTFAKEPDHMQKLPGLAETSRNYTFPHLLAYDSITDISLEVKVPRRFSRIEVSAHYRCESCELQRTAVNGWVNITWP